MLNLIVPNITCFQTQKQLASLNNIRVLLKSVLTDLRARNFARAKSSLHACCVHARHRACNLSSPVNSFLFAEEIVDKQLDFFKGCLDIDFLFTKMRLEKTTEICPNELSNYEL